MIHDTQHIPSRTHVKSHSEGLTLPSNHVGYETRVSSPKPLQNTSLIFKPLSVEVKYQDDGRQFHARINSRRGTSKKVWSIE